MDTKVNSTLMDETSNDAFIENHTYDELKVGQSDRLMRTLQPEDIQAFAAVSGDTNPAHLDPSYANDTLFHGVIAHGMWGGALISALLGTRFPGPGTIYLEQSLHFSRPVRIGDTLAVTATVTEMDDTKKRVLLECEVRNQHGDKVLHGHARVLAPTTKVRLPRLHAPRIQLFDPEARFAELLALAKGLPALRCAVVHPCSLETLGAAVDAAQRGLIVPHLIAPEARLRRMADEAGLDLADIPIVDTPHSHASAAAAVTMAAEGRVESLAKGSLHSSEFLSAIQAEAGLQTGRALSHVARFEVPFHHKPILLTDTVLNAQPSLETKADIVRNLIDLAVALGIGSPRIALLSASETITPHVVSSMDAAALCKMAERGQIEGAVLDGPLSFDSALSVHAAQIHQIGSTVAGHADALVVPGLESGHMLGRQLETLGGASSAGVLMGARVSVAMAHRTSPQRSHVASFILASLVAHARRTQLMPHH